MSTRSQQFALAADGSFQQRCVASAMAYCITTVFTEGAVANHADRVALMYQLFLYPANWSYRLALTCVMVNANLQNAAPSDAAAADSDINAAVASSWTGLALANTAAQASTWKQT